MLETIAAGELLKMVATAAAAFGGVKIAVGRNTKDISEISKDLKHHVAQDAAVQVEIVDRLARIETKINKNGA